MTSESGDNRLDELAEEFVRRLRNGERPEVSEYCAGHPELADEIGDLFPTLRVMEGVRQDSKDVEVVVQPGVTLLGHRLEALGDYRLLREVGRGGMGVVYEAEQESLGRHVALKVLAPHALLDSRYVLRFQREARAAARLHHTNIVPVFGVGVHAGMHYYVMQFISGMGLDAVLSELRGARGIASSRASSGGLLGSATPLSSERSLDSTETHVGGERPKYMPSVQQIADSMCSGVFAAPNGRTEGVSLLVNPASSDIRETRELTPNGTHFVSGTALAAGNSPENVDPESPVASAKPLKVSAIELTPPVRQDTGSSSTVLSQPGHAYWHSVARIGVQVAEAMDYAFRQGVLHRDIKPSNLLLDTQGNVWVTDFGLAKSVESDDLTQSGDVVGTLRYLAPERLKGKYDLRGDIYSLGITLYEMLTLRPAFIGSDHADLLRRIVSEEPPRPRSLDPSIPRDLETIVLKAIASAPADRYSTPAALATDLRQFLEDKPIHARRVGVTERLWRWSRRNPLVASLTGLVALLLVATVIVQSVSNARIRREVGATTMALQEKESALKDKERALQSASASEQLARRRFYAAEMNLAQQALQAGEPARVLDLLENQRPQPGETDWRGFEWHYLWQAIHQPLHVSLRVNDGEIWSLAFSPDGQTLAVGSGNERRGSLTLWAVKSGTRLAALGSDEEVVHAVDFSPDGKFLVSSSIRDAAVLWDVSERREVARLQTPSHLRSVDWSNDGRWIATGCQNGVVQLWDAATRELKAEFPPHKWEVAGLVFSPDGNRLYTAAGFDQGEMLTRVYDLTTLPPPPPREIPRWYVRDVSSDGNSIVGFYWGTIKIWDERENKQRWQEMVSPGCLNAVKFAADGRRMARAGFDDRLAEIWEEDSKTPLQRLPHAAAIKAVAFDPQKKYWASGSTDGEIKIWHDRTSEKPLSLQHDPAVWRMLMAPKVGTMFLGGDFPAEARDAISGELRVAPPARRLHAVSPDGQVLLAIIPTSSSAATTKDSSPLPETIEIWDRDGQAPRLSFRLPDQQERAWRAIALSNTGHWLATRQWDCPIRLWDVSGREVRQIAELKDTNCMNLCLSPDERFLVACCQFGRVRAWDLKTRTALPDLLGYESSMGWAMSATFSPDGRRVAAGNGSGIVRVWDFASQHLLATMKGHFGEIHDLAFFPDNRTLAVGGTGPIRLWDIETGQECLTLPVPDYKIEQLAISADGQTLFSRGDEGIVRWWTGRQLNRDNDHAR